MQKTFGSPAFHALEDQVRANMAFFSDAMRMWSPFPAAQKPDTNAEEPAQDPGEIETLKRQVADMQGKLEALTREKQS